MMVDREKIGGQTWIVGVDGSENSVHALKWAVRHAPTRASTLRVIRAWSVPTTGGLEMMPATIDDFRPATAYEFLDEVIAELEPHGVAVEGLVTHGTASSVLLDACDDADLLIVGTRGLGGFARLLLGSTSHQCATHARIPVIAVPSTIDANAALESIVVGMDASPGARCALAWTLEFAPIDVVIHTVGAWSRAGWIRADLEDADTDIDEALVEFHAAVGEVENARSESGRTERSFVQDHPTTALLEASSTADLLVVGERGRRGLKAALLGSATTEVLHRSDRPIVVVPVNE
jgi:nucleotide-binding universal stress UspA family protein